MLRKLTAFLTLLVLTSSWITPASLVQAQGTPPVCPPYEAGLLNDKDLLESLPQECVRTYKEASREAAPRRAGGTPASVTTLAAGGPDQFGYTYDSAVPYNWIPAGMNSGLSGDDVALGPVDIGFPFPFYGTSQTQLYFNTNGLITFGGGSLEWDAFSIPNDLNPNNLIAAFWDDLLVGSPYNNGAIYYSRGGSAPNRYFVLEWRDVQNYDDEITRFSFEAILHENGDIVIQHKSLPFPTSPAWGSKTAAATRAWSTSTGPAA
jgi:hypothetical protein